MKRAILSQIMVLGFTGMLFCSAAQNDEVEILKKTGKAFSEVAKKAIPAVVYIEVEKTITRGGDDGMNDPLGFFGDEFFQRFFGERGYGMRPRQFKQSGQGSGFLISKDGYILTNNHVAGDADKITVKLQDGRKLDAKRIGTDPKSEVALIKIEGDAYPFIELGDSALLDIGEWVIAVGNPFGLTETLTVGVVSAVGRSNIGITDYEDFIQTDAAINPGNSGGPLLNIEGKAVGINTAILSGSGGYMGIGFAIPINMVKAITEQLKDKGSVTRGFLGIQLNPQDLDEDMAKSFGLDAAGGVLVAETVKGSPAETAGLKNGDIILELNGTPARNNRTFRNSISMMAPGTKVKLTVFRDGKKIQVEAAIGEMEGAAKAAEEGGGGEDAMASIGAKVRELTPEIAEQLGYEQGQEGVVISEVEPDGSAARAMLQPGVVVLSVNRMPVKTVKEFNKALQAATKTGRILLRVKNPHTSWFVLLRAE